MGCIMRARRLEDWTRDYAPLPGIPDEYMDSKGRSRPNWKRASQRRIDEFAITGFYTVCQGKRTSGSGQSAECRCWSPKKNGATLLAESPNGPNCSNGCSLTFMAKVI